MSSLHYGAWMQRFIPLVQFDLATSGVLPSNMEPPCYENVTAPKEAANKLRMAIARRFRLDFDEVLPVMGASQGLWLGYSALLRPGETVVVENPTYERLLRSAFSIGANVLRFDRLAHEGFTIDIDRILACVTPSTRVVTITNPHNPSGVQTSDGVLRMLAERLAERGTYLFVDEVYAPFFSPNGLPETARRLAPNVVATGSLTKAYGLGSKRVGWLLGPAGIIAPAASNFDTVCGAPPLSWTIASEASLAKIGALSAGVCDELAKKRTCVASWIENSPNLSWSNPQKGIFALVSAQSDDDLRPVIEVGAARHDVLVVPGIFFGVPNSFRLSWSIALPRLEEGLARLSAVLKDAGR